MLHMERHFSILQCPYHYGAEASTITTASTPVGHHTPGIELKGMLPIGVYRMLAGNRVG